MVMHKVSATPREAGAVQAMLLMLAALLPIMGTLTMLPVMPLPVSYTHLDVYKRQYWWHWMCYSMNRTSPAPRAGCI